MPMRTFISTIYLQRMVEINQLALDTLLKVQQQIHGFQRCMDCTQSTAFMCFDCGQVQAGAMCLGPLPATKTLCASAKRKPGPMKVAAPSYHVLFLYMEAPSKIPDSTERKAECKRITRYGYQKVDEWCYERFHLSFAKANNAIQSKTLLDCKITV